MTETAKSPNGADRRIGERIRLQRLARDMSQQALAEALGITFQQIQKYERGTNRVSASRLQEIARVLQVPVMFFFDEKPSGQGATFPMPDSPQSQSLLRAYQAISDPGLQKQAVALVQTLAAVKK
ncbi:helix-turn-helix domain-containing protein [Microvirga puerhi]|uniref:Helix-turn-helix domain-containing protein n=1 Tax=Microvirga puerhi TaxID=2876078 RepID=A0ABS7VI20_9HYPH|nr:helix-turn-helix transcriptional regulator [Microvirga puerhi]MBZ6074904.1 helix-turn-helix domain-containing protein [Microvirga puerhi]